MEDVTIMKRAIEVAEAEPRYPFGALIVDSSSGEIVCEGVNRSSVNATWHGEIVAINRFYELGEIAAADCVLYTTAEPCPMCQSAILWAGFQAVVYGTSIAYLTHRGWHQIQIPSDELCRRTPFSKCKIHGGILEQECNALFDKALQLQAGEKA